MNAKQIKSLAFTAPHATVTDIEKLSDGTIKVWVERDAMEGVVQMLKDGTVIKADKWAK